MKVAEALHCTGGVTLGGYRSILNSLRVEKQFMHWGHDVGPEDTPLEAGLAFVSARKLKSDVGFVGRSVLEQQKADGLPKRLMSFKVMAKEEEEGGAGAGAGSMSLWGNEIIWVDGKKVGKITSGGVGYTVNNGMAIGMGYVRKDPDDGQSVPVVLF